MSWRLTRRDWSAGELRLLLLALVVAVAAIASVGFFVDRMAQALSQQARQLLGADLVIASDRPLDERLAAQARERGLDTALTVNFPSMVLSGERAQLASIKAVSPGYPLRGGLRVADVPNQADRPVQGVPPARSGWADAQLAQSLGLTLPGRVKLGDSELTIERVLTLEPDRGTNFVNFAPRLMIPLDDLAATGLIQPTSRVTYRLQIAGPRAAVSAYADWVTDRLERGQRLESLDNGRPELRVTLERAEKFLALVAMLTALIAAVAIALATRRFAERHLDGCAVMRAIGITQRRLVRLLMLELLWVGVAGALLGGLAGWALHLALVSAVSPLLQMPLPAPSLWPLARATLAGLVLLLGFGAFPFLRLSGVSPLRVLRRDLGAAGAGAWVATGAAVTSFAVLLYWFAGDRQLATIALGGFLGGALVFSLVAYGLVLLLGPLRRWAARSAVSPALRMALASWSRRRGVAVAQTVALAAGLMALILLTVTRTDLLDGWRRASPHDAPNRYVINIQPDQRAAVSAELAAAGITRPDLYPMVRGRLVSVNGAPVSSEQFTEERARQLVDREFNLSYTDTQPGHNQTVEGRWLDPRAAEVSAEQGIMKTLGLKLGDRLGFDIAGETVEVAIVGVRKLAWDSMKVNFFMILSPQSLRDRPQTLITAYHQPPGQALDTALVRRHPNLTVFDTGHIVRQVQSMLDQVVRAVEFLFVLTLIAGLVVLYAALASSRDERLREAGLMRALGASRRQLLRAQVWELGLAGGIAGGLAAVGATVIGLVLAARVFQFDYDPRISGLALGIAAGALAAIGAGWMGLRGVLNTPPMTTLRNA